MSREGLALMSVVLVATAVLVLGTGALALATRQRAAARTEADAFQAHLAAEAGIASLAAAGPDLRALAPSALVPVAVGSTSLGSPGPPQLSAVVTVLRLGRETWIVDAVGRVDPTGAVARLARAYWALDPVGRLDGTPAALEAGAMVVEPGGVLTGGGSGSHPTGWSASECSTEQPAIDTVLSAGPRPPSSALRPDPAASAGPVPWLGALDGPALLGAAQPIVGSVVAPAPVVGPSGCDTAVPSNWGSPSDPAGPCGRYWPLLGTGGDLTVGGGGEGQGALVVQGDLTFSNVRFAGAVWVGGDLVVGVGAQVEGAARVRGTARVRAGGSLRFTPCPLVRAFGSPGLPRSARPAQPGSWIEPY